MVLVLRRAKGWPAEKSTEKGHRTGQEQVQVQRRMILEIPASDHIGEMNLKRG